jgi:beta-galactosidase
VDAAAVKEQASLEFEGAFQDAEVWVNGKKAGEHLGGYTGFSLDITGDLHAGDNVIAVRANNLWNGQLNPRAGEHVFSGGIYRDVYLVTTAAVHVPWYGTFVTTPKVSNDAATIDVKTEVRNSSEEAATVVLKTAILDPTGKQVAEYSTEQKIDAGELATVDQSGVVSGPKLWSPETPRLYTAVSRIVVKGVVQDAIWNSLVYLDGGRWVYVEWEASLLPRRECASGPRGLGRCGEQRGRAARCGDGEGGGLRLHSRLALPAQAGVCGCVR